MKRLYFRGYHWGSLTHGLVVAAILWAVPAWSQPSEDKRIEAAQDAVMEGTRLLKSGEYSRGIEAFRRAYQSFPQERHLFVIASAYERIQGQCQGAIAAWQNYLEKCKECKDRVAAQQRLDKQKKSCTSQAENGDTALSKVIAQAKARLNAGKVMGAVMAYENAYRIKPEPRFLFAVASAYEQMDGRCADAILGWERFLNACDNCSERAAGQARQQQNKARCAQADKAESPVAVASSTADKPASKDDGPAQSKQEKSPSASAESNGKLFGYAGLGVGVLATLVAINLSGTASDEEDKLTSDSLEAPVDPDEKKRREDDIQSTQRLSVLSASVGVGALIVGAYILFADPEEPTKKGAYLVPSRDGAFAGAYFQF